MPNDRPRIRRPKRLLLLLSALVFIGLLCYAAFKPEKVHYVTATVKRMDLEKVVLASGYLAPSKLVEVGLRASGQITSLKVGLGEQVKKGQLLAQIDPILSENELREAQANLEAQLASQREKEIALDHARLVYRRQKKIYAHHATARADLEKAKADLNQIDAQLASIAAQIKSAQSKVSRQTAELHYTQVTAPIDGEVIAIMRQEGQMVNARQDAPTLLKLANLSSMTVKVPISEADITHVHPGLPVYFTIFSEPDHRYDARLASIEPIPEEKSTEKTSSAAVYYNGIFEVPNVNKVLRPNMTAQVSIVTDRVQNALTIPTTALGRKNQDGSYTVRVLKNEQSVPRTIHIGLNNHIQVQVVSGLTENEQVILDNLPASAEYP